MHAARRPFAAVHSCRQGQPSWRLSQILHILFKCCTAKPKNEDLRAYALEPAPRKRYYLLNYFAQRSLRHAANPDY